MAFAFDVRVNEELLGSAKTVLVTKREALRFAASVATVLVVSLSEGATVGAFVSLLT